MIIRCGFESSRRVVMGRLHRGRRRGWRVWLWTSVSLGSSVGSVWRNGETMGKRRNNACMREGSGFMLGTGQGGMREAPRIGHTGLQSLEDSMPWMDTPRRLVGSGSCLPSPRVEMGALTSRGSQEGVEKRMAKRASFRHAGEGCLGLRGAHGRGRGFPSILSHSIRGSSYEGCFTWNNPSMPDQVGCAERGWMLCGRSGQVCREGRGFSL